MPSKIKILRKAPEGYVSNQAGRFTTNENQQRVCATVTQYFPDKFPSKRLQTLLNLLDTHEIP
jgi:hypothetical protein